MLSFVEIKLFALLVKEQRAFYERPFKRYKLTTLAGLEEYVADDKDKFLESLNKHSGKDDPGIVLKKEVIIISKSCPRTTEQMQI